LDVTGTTIRTGTVILLGLVPHRQSALHQLLIRSGYVVLVARSHAAVPHLVEEAQRLRGRLIAMCDGTLPLDEVLPTLGSVGGTGSDLPIIMLVSPQSVADPVALRSGVIADCLQLPAQPGEILEALARVLSGRAVV
jgi:DNA-binding response OmpR family regulator